MRRMMHPARAMRSLFHPLLIFGSTSRVLWGRTVGCAAACEPARDMIQM